MKRLQLLPLLVIAILTACSGSQPPAGAPSSTQPKLSSSEPLYKGDQAYIDEMNALIDEIATPLTDEELKLFSIAGVLPFSARFILIGERHNNFDGIMLQARALQRFATSKDTLLFETPGAADCPIIVRNLYFVRRYNDRYSEYDVEKAKVLQAALLEPYKRLYRKLHLDKLSFRNATCMGWDHPERTPEQGFDMLATRNRMMVTRVSDRSSASNDKIFVVAGFYHLPTGDVDKFKDYAPSRNLHAYFRISSEQLKALRPPSYYKMLKDSTDRSKHSAVEVHNAQQIIKGWGFGSTEVIFDYFKAKNFSELIPAELLGATQPCGPACD